MSYLQKPTVVGAIFASLSLSLLGLAWYNQKNLLVSQRISNHIQRCSSMVISKDKIIFAFDPQNLFVKFSWIKKEGYKPLRQKQGHFHSLFFKTWSKRAPCYLQRVSGKCIRNFLRRLKEMRNVQVVLYTKLEQQYCNEMLQNIGIQHFFPPDKQYFTKNKFKSAEEIDCDTRRVVIITANHEDQRDGIMSSHHNLILSLQHEEMDQNFMLRLQQYLERLASFGRTDTLHEQMYDLALEMRIPLYNYQSMLVPHDM